MSRASWTKRGIILSAALAFLFGASVVHAYDQFSQNGGDATNCGACHGDFRSNLYISNTDGQLWGNLHDIHRSDMLDGDCDTCHSSGGRFPVLLNSSSGGDGLAAIGCTGCHGRAEDDTAANPDFPDGSGAGLRQQHHVAGVAVCNDCHEDADPAKYTPVDEDVLPPYYANPGSNHPAMPTAPCNADGSENFAGAADGLDNDGDGIYDGADSDCSTTATPPVRLASATLGQNAPNPFNPTTVIPYTLLVPGRVQLRVYDVSGQLVRTLVDAWQDEAGDFSTTWNGRNARDREVPSGVYYYRLDTVGTPVSKNMVLVR
jgi:hypothetical protein